MVKKLVTKEPYWLVWNQLLLISNCHVRTGLAKDIFDAIPASLSGNASRYVLSNAREGIRSEQVRELIPDMLSSFTVNIAYHANNPGATMSLEKDARGNCSKRKKGYIQIKSFVQI